MHGHHCSVGHIEPSDVANIIGAAVHLTNQAARLEVKDAAGNSHSSKANQKKSERLISQILQLKVT